MSKDKLINVAKWTAKIAVSSSVSKVIHDVIDANVAAETRLDKAQIWIGSIVLATVGSSAALNHIEEMVNESNTRVAEMKSEKDNTETE